jgi:preprotein translocase subunit SecG
MLMTVLKVIYVVVAVLMTIAILMQRGAGAQAGSGFGAGASATVFGARGSANFLSTSTKWLAIAFFGLSIWMAYLITHGARPQATIDAGVMSGVGSETPAAAGESTPGQPTSGQPAEQGNPASTNGQVPAGEVPPVMQSTDPAGEMPPAAANTPQAEAVPSTKVEAEANGADKPQQNQP